MDVVTAGVISGLIASLIIYLFSKLYVIGSKEKNRMMARQISICIKQYVNLINKNEYLTSIQEANVIIDRCINIYSNMRPLTYRPTQKKLIMTLLTDIEYRFENIKKIDLGLSKNKEFDARILDICDEIILIDVKCSIMTDLIDDDKEIKWILYDNLYNEDKYNYNLSIEENINNMIGELTESIEIFRFDEEKKILCFSTLKKRNHLTFRNDFRYSKNDFIKCLTNELKNAISTKNINKKNFCK